MIYGDSERQRGNDSFWDPSTYQRRHVILTSSTPNNSARWYVSSLSWTLVSNHFNQSRVAFTNWLVHSLLRALLPKSANSTTVEFSTYTSIFHGHLVVDFSKLSCFLWQLSRTSCGFTNLQFHQAKLLPTWLRCAYPSGPGMPVRGPPVAAQKLRRVPWWFEHDSSRVAKGGSNGYFILWYWYDVNMIWHR